MFRGCSGDRPEDSVQIRRPDGQSEGCRGGERAIELARSTGKDPRLIQLVLTESKEVLRAVDQLIIVVHRLGFVLANAGIDVSNVGPEGSDGQVLLLPENPDRTAQNYRASILSETGANVGVIINDSVGPGLAYRDSKPGDRCCRC